MILASCTSKLQRTVSWVNEMLIRIIIAGGARLQSASTFIVDINAGRPHVNELGMWLTLIMPRRDKQTPIDVLVLMTGKSAEVCRKPTAKQPSKRISCASTTGEGHILFLRRVSTR